MNPINQWRESPALRFLVRNVVVAAAGYLIEALRNEDTFSLSALGVAAALAGLTSLIGLLTPVEPFVGVNKTEVEVPSPPAIPEDNSDLPVDDFA